MCRSIRISPKGFSLCFQHASRVCLCSQVLCWCAWCMLRLALCQKKISGQETGLEGQLCRCSTSSSSIEVHKIDGSCHGIALREVVNRSLQCSITKCGKTMRCTYNVSEATRFNIIFPTTVLGKFAKPGRDDVSIFFVMLMS